MGDTRTTLERAIDHDSQRKADAAAARWDLRVPQAIDDEVRRIATRENMTLTALVVAVLREVFDPV